MKRLTTLFVVLVAWMNTNAQEDQGRVWNNHACAVSLTYDDGLNVHLDIVAKALDSAGFKGTFYIPVVAKPLYKRMDEWSAISKNGHELGNHTMFHPCSGKSKGREWVSEENDLDNYSMKQIVNEIGMANVVLKTIDGKDRRTIAYTCGDMAAGDSVFVGKIKNDFISARGVASRMNTFWDTDLFDVGAYMVMNQTGDELINLVKQAQQEHAYLVFLFHGVGGEHAINVSSEAHSQLVHYLKSNEKDIWVAPFIEVTDYMKDQRDKE
jgi:peptidoglycan/xylan/chitin deacetylase (PgdA/CDA1 family)